MKLCKRKDDVTKLGKGARNMKTYEIYKKAKKEVNAKSKVYNDQYNRLGTKERENDNFKLANMREMTRGDLDYV